MPGCARGDRRGGEERFGVLLSAAMYLPHTRRIRERSCDAAAGRDFGDLHIRPVAPSLGERFCSTPLGVHMRCTAAAVSGCGRRHERFLRRVRRSEKAWTSNSATTAFRGVPPDASLCLFRVLQEALHNAVRHSGARHFGVHLRGTADVIDLTVRDEGAVRPWPSFARTLSDTPPPQRQVVSRPKVEIVLKGWSGRRGSNPRHRAWEARVLPLNYSRGQ